VGCATVYDRLGRLDVSRALEMRKQGYTPITSNALAHLPAGHWQRAPLVLWCKYSFTGMPLSDIRVTEPSPSKNQWLELFEEGFALLPEDLSVAEMDPGKRLWVRPAEMLTNVRAETEDLVGKLKQELPPRRQVPIPGETSVLRERREVAARVRAAVDAELASEEHAKVVSLTADFALTDGDVLRMRSVFHAIDVDRSGSVSADELFFVCEFKDGARAVGEFAVYLFGIFDIVKRPSVGGSGLDLQFSDFIKVMCCLCLFEQPDMFQLILGAVMARSPFMDPSDFRQVILQLHSTESAGRLVHITRALDHFFTPEFLMDNQRVDMEMVALLHQRFPQLLHPLLRFQDRLVHLCFDRRYWEAKKMLFVGEKDKLRLQSHELRRRAQEDIERNRRLAHAEAGKDRRLLWATAGRASDPAARSPSPPPAAAAALDGAAAAPVSAAARVSALVLRRQASVGAAQGGLGEGGDQQAIMALERARQGAEAARFVSLSGHSDTPVAGVRSDGDMDMEEGGGEGMSRSV
jgi:hypothetical protein